MHRDDASHTTGLVLAGPLPVSHRDYCSNLKSRGILDRDLRVHFRWSWGVNLSRETGSEIRPISCLTTLAVEVVPHSPSR